MSAFDPKTFINTSFNEGVDTRTALHRAGDWTGMIGTGDNDVAARTARFKDKETGMDVERQLWEVVFYADDPAAQDEGFDPPARTRYTMFLDFTPSGTLDFSAGKNRTLGNLLTALGFQDKTGKLLKPWNPQAWKGMRLRYRVEHKPGKEPGEIYANVTAVSGL